MDRVRLKRLIAYASSHGAKPLTPFQWEWDVSSRCQSPVRREIAPRAPKSERIWSHRSADAVADTFRDVIVPEPMAMTLTKVEEPYSLLLTVACRRCEWCRKKRSRMWRHKAIAETRSAPRTWFGTLTLRPESYFRFLSQARAKAAKRGRVDFAALAYSEQFSLVHQEIGREVTLVLKRLRKAGHGFRYLFVAEAHKSGVPHYHVLLHEKTEPIRKATLDKCWPFGFTQWKLADENSASYVCKYLTKNAAARVRASIRYGETSALTSIGGSQSLREILTPKEPTGAIGSNQGETDNGLSSEGLSECDGPSGCAGLSNASPGQQSQSHYAETVE